MFNHLKVLTTTNLGTWTSAPLSPDQFKTLFIAPVSIVLTSLIRTSSVKNTTNNLYNVHIDHPGARMLANVCLIPYVPLIVFLPPAREDHFICREPPTKIYKKQTTYLYLQGTKRNRLRSSSQAATNGKQCHAYFQAWPAEPSRK